MKRVLLLGSTGSIGTQTLDLLRRARSDFQLVGLTARRSTELLLEQVREFEPSFVGVADPDAADRIADELPEGVKLFRGPDAPEVMAAECDYDLCVHGVVGAAGVLPSRRVLERGRALALANKESLVVAGAELMELSKRNDAPILPVDSEHAAIYQCLHGEDVRNVRMIYLTASGGAVRDRPLDELAGVRPEDALQHPNWSMGQRITVDSATLMNKALEIIETHHLYGVGCDRIRVVLHRQSIVHSMVEFDDGSLIAQMSPPDMRGPIHFALHHPDRAPNPHLKGFDLDLFRELTFGEPDPERYPALELGYRAVREGGSSGCVLNAADEVAVEAFLEHRIGFQDIVRVSRSVMERAGEPELRPAANSADATDPIGDLLAIDARAREMAGKLASELDSAVS